MTKSAEKSSTRRGNKRPFKAQATAANSARAKAVVAARAAAVAAAVAAKAIAEAEIEGADVSDLVEDERDWREPLNDEDNEVATPGETAAPGKGEDYLDFLSRMFDNMGGAQNETHKYDDMSRGVGMVLGSGPAFAALESMFASTNAQSAVLMNATQTQRQLDHVGLCCTSACVKQLLNLKTGQDSD